MQSLWERLLDRLETEYSEQDILTWLKPLQVGGSEGVLRLLAPNAFVLDVVRERFLSRIEAVAQHLDGGDLVVRLDVGSTPRVEPARSATTNNGTVAVPFDPEFETNLDPHYTFDNFVEGKSNELGRAAAYQAWWEHQPVRVPRARSWADLTIHRSTAWGSLAQLWTLDTRQYRSDQPCNDGNRVVPCGDWGDPTRTLMGTDQEKWLFNGLGASTATWQVLAQQVALGELCGRHARGDRANRQRRD